MHPAIQSGAVALVTGGASGIGAEIARRLTAMGLKVAVADLPGPALDAVSGAQAFAADVSDPAQVAALKQQVEARLGPVQVLFNNAGIQPGSDIFDSAGTWQRVIDVNLGGIVHVAQAFGPDMAASGKPGLIVNTGSKQGITTPPGDTSYNVSKGTIKVLTEGLSHQLRNTEGCRVSAHLLIPGFTFTGGLRKRLPERPASAWEPEQVADRLIQGLEADEFYILCEDNETTREMDEKRIYWAAHDLIENRPALSRWHPDWKERFEAFMAQGKLPRS